MLFSACTEKRSTETFDSSKQKEADYIRVIDGTDRTLDPEIIKRGEVLIAYSDCSECHRPNKRAKGPAFQDIARRYPIQPAYIDLLARKVISGGTGSWGSPVMSAHPNLDEDDARAMVSYILSLEE